MFITKVISNFIESGFRKIKVLATIDPDVRTAQQISPFGIDSAPIKGMKAIYAPTNKNGKNVIVGYYNKSLLAQDGETRLFSIDGDGILSTFIWLKSDGTLQIGGSENHMTRFEDLKIGFDQLREDFNAHTHPSNGAPPSIPSTANIDDSKIDEIETI